MDMTGMLSGSSPVFYTFHDCLDGAILLDFFYTVLVPLYCCECVHSGDFCTIALEMASKPKIPVNSTV